MAHLPERLLQLGKLQACPADITFVQRQQLHVPMHAHDTDNYGMVTEGTLYLTLAGEEHAYRSGEWFEIPAGTPHAERFEEKTSLIVVWIKR